ncbi:mitotic checkpoint protein BUB3.1 [Lactarius tabidus]
MSESQVELKGAPFDSISSVQFSPTNSNSLLVSSWDSTVRLYDIKANEEKTKFDHRAAVLSSVFSDVSHAYSGGLDASLRELELESEKIHALGQHDDAISSVRYSSETSSFRIFYLLLRALILVIDAIITGSWDRTVRFWDPRASTAQQSSQQLPERVYFMDTVGNRLVIALASRLFHIFDVRKMDTPEQTRESSLKFLTRALACMSDGQGYATASVEGRIAVEYFDPSPAVQEKKYAFKCHRQTIDDVDHVWPGATISASEGNGVASIFASSPSAVTYETLLAKDLCNLRRTGRYSRVVNTTLMDPVYALLPIPVRSVLTAQSAHWHQSTSGFTLLSSPHEDALFERSKKLERS